MYAGLSYINQLGKNTEKSQYFQLLVPVGHYDLCPILRKPSSDATELVQSQHA